MTTIATASSSEFSKGWKVLFAGVIGVACGASPLPFNVLPFLAFEVTAEFGWTQVQAVLPLTIFGIIAALLAPVIGSLADKYGVRPVALWSMFAFALAFAAVSLTPTAQEPSTLYIYYSLWVAVGLVGIGSTPVTFTRAINLWFYENRGLALGILLLGTSLTAIILPNLTVGSINAYGWRTTMVIIAIFPLTALVVCYFLFREPRNDERPAGVGDSTGKLTGVSLPTALHNYRFYLIWISIALISVSFAGAAVNMPRILALKGIDINGAATVAMTLGIGIFIGKLSTGFLLDRIWQGFVSFPLLCLPAISAVILLDDSLTLSLAVIAGFLIGFAAGAESDLMAYLAGRYFGMAHYGKIFGMFYLAFGVFAAASPVIYAQTFDATGSFDQVLTLAIGGFIIGGGLLLFLGKYPDSFPVDEADEEAAVTA